MGRKVLLGCTAVAALMALVIGTVVALRTNGGGGAGTDMADDETSLSQRLTMEFGSPAKVEFVCVYPVVGIGPCIPRMDMGTHNVTLTFAAFGMFQEIEPEEVAHLIARRAFTTSQFAKTSAEIKVIFAEGNATRSYNFSGEDLAAGEVSSSGAAEGSAKTGEATDSQ